MARCFKNMQRLKLFGCTWWLGKQYVGDLEKSKVSLCVESCQKLYEKVGVDPASVQQCIINPTSKKGEYFCAVGIGGVYFVQPAKKQANRAAFYRKFSFSPNSWEKVLLWGARQNVIQMIVTSVHGNPPACDVMKINIMSHAAVD